MTDLDLTIPATPHEPSPAKPANPAITPECPACGYDLRATQSCTCSECGWTSSPEDTIVAAKRSRFLNQPILRLLAPGLTVLGATLIVSILFIAKGYQPAGWYLITLAIITTLFGPTVSIPLPRHRRKSTNALWITIAYRLHLPVWIGAFTSIFFFPIQSLLDSENTLILIFKSIASLLLLLSWAWLCGLAFLHWYKTWTNLTEDSYWIIQQQKSRTILRRGAIILFALNVLTGMGAFWAVVLLILMNDSP